jgi:lipoprotein-releasing system permease protein
MNIEHFIAKRIAFTKDKTFTKVIIRIAIAAIAISLSIMILTTAIIHGFKKEISHKIFGFWGHIHVTDANVNRNFEVLPINTADSTFAKIKGIKNVIYQAPKEIYGFQFSDQLQEKQSIGGVKSVNPYLMLPSLINTKEAFHGILLKGLDNNYEWDRMKNFLVQGSLINFADTSRRQILVSKNIADKLEINVNDKVILAFIRDQQQIKKRFEVVGIYNTGLEEYDRRFCLVDISQIRDVLGWSPNQAQGMEIILDDIQDMDAITDYIYYEILPDTYYAETIRNKFPSIFEWLNLQDINEKIIMILMVVVAIINMITVLLILILERTRMIGTLKSLGMTSWSIRKIFIYNAGYIIAFGLLIGNILGLGIAYLQKTTGLIKLDEANYYLDTAPIDIPWLTVVGLNIGVLMLTLVFLILPTMLVTRITPVKVLRFE